MDLWNFTQWPKNPANSSSNTSHRIGLTKKKHNRAHRADALVSGGFLAAGYKTISIDDCWEQTSPPRDAQGRLAPDPSRFPSGFKALADYVRALDETHTRIKV